MTYKRTTVDGHTLNVRTAQMLKRAEARTGLNLVVSQGSYNAGGVAASAGTHDGGGALDISVQSHSQAEINQIVLGLRQVGFAAWHRLPSQGDWPEHIHGIAIGDEELSSGAANQVRYYKERLNGLGTHLPDDGPRLDPIPEWPVKLKGVSLKNIQNQFNSTSPRKVLAVKKLQEVLNYRLETDIPEDGIAGPLTEQTYKKWEQYLGIDHPDTKPGAFQLKKLFAGWYTLQK